jgi:hypothetical protein
MTHRKVALAVPTLVGLSSLCGCGLLMGDALDVNLALDAGSDAAADQSASDQSASDGGSGEASGPCTTSCGAGQHCVNGACACDPTSCTGCCSGSTCVTGTDLDACGSGGAACVACTGVTTCGSAGCGTCPLRGKALTMIDDGSEAVPSAAILPQCGRVGAWYTFHDSTSTQTPATGASFPFSTSSPPNGVAGYVDTYGTLSNAAAYGAGLGFYLNAPTSTPEDYDATAQAYTGISFWIRVGSSPSTQPAILLEVLDAGTQPTANGLYFHQAQISPPPQGAWTKYSYKWSDLHQPVTTEPSLQVKRLRAVAWQLNGTSPGTNTAQPYDVAIGDVEFTQ